MCKVFVSDRRVKEAAECKMLHSTIKSFKEVCTDLYVLIVAHTVIECLEVIAIDTITGIEAPRIYIPTDFFGSINEETESVRNFSDYWSKEILDNLKLTVQRSDGSFEVAIEDEYDDSDFWKKVPTELTPFAVEVYGEDEDCDDCDTIIAEEDCDAPLVSSGCLAVEEQEKEQLPTPTLNYMTRDYDRDYVKPSVVQLHSLTDRFPIKKQKTKEEEIIEDNPWNLRERKHHVMSKLDVEKKYEQYKKLTEQNLFNIDDLGESIDVPLEVGPFPCRSHRDSSFLKRSNSFDSVSTLSFDDEEKRHSFSLFGKHFNSFVSRASFIAGAVVPKRLKLRFNKVHVAYS